MYLQQLSISNITYIVITIKNCLLKVDVGTHVYYVKLFIYKENNLCSPLQLQLIYLFDFFDTPSVSIPTSVSVLLPYARHFNLHMISSINKINIYPMSRTWYFIDSSKWWAGGWWLNIRLVQTIPVTISRIPTSLPCDLISKWHYPENENALIFLEQ